MLKYKYLGALIIEEINRLTSATECTFKLFAGADKKAQGITFEEVLAKVLLELYKIKRLINTTLNENKYDEAYEREINKIIEKIKEKEPDFDYEKNDTEKDYFY